MICTPPVLNQQPMYHNHLNHNQQLHYPVQQLHDQQPQQQHQQQQQQQQQSLPQLPQPPQPQQQPQPQAPQHPQHQQVAYLSDQNQQQQQQFAQQQDDDFQRYNNMRFEHLQQQIVELHTLLEQQQQVISYMQQQMSQEHLKLYDYIANVTGTNNNNTTATATAAATTATSATTTTTTTNNNNNDNKSNSTSAPSNNSFINTNSPNKFRNNSVVGINGFNQVNIPPINLNNMASPTAEYNGGVNIHTPGGSISNNNNTAVNTTNTASSNNSTNNNAVHRNGSLSYIASTTSLLNHHQPPPQALTPSATNNNNSQNYQIPNHPHNTNNSSFNNNGINASGSMSQLNIHRNAISSNDSYNNPFGYLSNNGISNGINGFSNLQNTTSQFLKNATLAGSQSNIYNSNNNNNNNNNNISASVFNNGNNTNNTINSRFAAGINNNNSNIGIHGQINNSSGDNYLVKAANVATNHHNNSLSDSDHKNSISDNDSSKNGNSVSMTKDDSYKHSLNLITSTNNNDSDDELARNSHNNNKNSNPTTITTSNSLTNDIDNSDSDAHQHGSDTKKTAFLSPVKANVKGTLTDTNMHISNSASSRNMGHGLNMEQENEDNANAEGEMDDEEDNEILDKEITTNNTVVEDEESKLGTRGNETKSLGTRALQKSKGYDAPSAERSNSLDYQELLAHHPELAQFDWNPCVSVLQIYQRFYHGLGNTPSVIEMEEKYGTIWRSQKCKLTLETSRVIAREFTIIKLVDLVNKVVLSILMSDGSEKNFTIDDAINVTQQYFNKVLTREPKLRNMSDHIRTTKIFANFDMVASKFSNLRFAENKLEIAKNYSSVTMKKYRWHLGGI